MTEWVLVLMLYTRPAQPLQAVIYPTRKECYDNITKKETTWTLPSHYCVPLIREKKP